MDRERDFKANSAHWAVILDVLDVHPELILNTSETHDSDKENKQKLWSALVNRLNALGYGQKTLDKWQLAIGRWKSKVKAKAAAIYQEQKATGGGPGKAPPLTEIEERLMGIIKWKSVKGTGNTELGFSKKTSEITAEVVQTATIEPPPLVPFLETQSAQPISRQWSTDISQSDENQVNSIIREVDHENLPSQSSTSTSATRGKLKRKSGVTEPVTKRRVITTSDKSRKFVTMNQMHTDTLTVLKQIQKQLTEMNSNQTRIANAIERYVQYTLDGDQN